MLLRTELWQFNISQIVSVYGTNALSRKKYQKENEPFFDVMLQAFAIFYFQGILNSFKASFPKI